MAIVKKSELFRKAENDYRKIKRASDRCLAKLDPEIRQTVLDQCFPEIRARLQNMFNDMRAKMSQNSFIDIIVTHFIPNTREAAIYSIDLIYNVISGNSLRDKKAKLDSFFLSIAVVLSNTAWCLATLSIFMLYNAPDIAAIKARILLTIGIAPMLEETAKSVALERGEGYKFTAIFGGMEFIQYVIDFAPKYGFGNIVVIRTVAWMFHFFTLVVQDIIPDKSFSLFLAVLFHMAWNAGLGAKVLSPMITEHSSIVKRLTQNGNRI